MGSASADGYAEAVREGYASLRGAIAANLTSNHYPPLPVAYVEPIILAIDAVTGGSRDTLIVLPEGLNPLPREAHWSDEAEAVVVNCAYLLDITHSWGFAYPDDEED
jgi:hypothetical protein